MIDSATVVCRGCGWASFAVTSAQAEREIRTMTDYINSLPPTERRIYGGLPSLRDYRCFRCGGQVFRRALAGDVPRGATLGQVICEELAGRDTNLLH